MGSFEPKKEDVCLNFGYPGAGKEWYERERERERERDLVQGMLRLLLLIISQFRRNTLLAG